MLSVWHSISACSYTKKKVKNLKSWEGGKGPQEVIHSNFHVDIYVYFKIIIVTHYGQFLYKYYIKSYLLHPYVNPKKIRHSQDHLNIFGTWSTLSLVGFYAALRRKNIWIFGSDLESKKNQNMTVNWNKLSRFSSRLSKYNQPKKISVFRKSQTVGYNLNSLLENATQKRRRARKYRRGKNSRYTLKEP